MEWQTDDDGLLYLRAYNGADEIAKLIVSGNDGKAPIFEVRCRFLSYGFEILTADTEDEAKAEAMEMVKDSIESERD